MKLARFRRPALCASIALLSCLGTLLAVRARAAGIPDMAALTYTGYLAGADGAALTGAHSITVRFWATAEGGKALCSGDTADAELVAGRFQVAIADCIDVVHANPDLFVDVQVDGASLGRTKVGAVPYAVEAQNAQNAVEAAHATSADTATSAEKAAGALKTTVDALGARLDLKVTYKGGNNGTVSCDAWCASTTSGDGKTGTCVGAHWDNGPLAGQYSRCSDTTGTTGQSAAANLQCSCAHP